MAGTRQQQPEADAHAPDRGPIDALVWADHPSWRALRIISAAQLALFFAQLPANEPIKPPDEPEPPPEPVDDNGGKPATGSQKPAKPKQGSRKPLPASMRREIVKVPIPKDELRCGDAEKKLIGTRVRITIEYRPGEAYAREEHAEVRARGICESNATTATTAAPPIEGAHLPLRARSDAEHRHECSRGARGPRWLAADRDRGLAALDPRAVRTPTVAIRITIGAEIATVAVDISFASVVNTAARSARTRMSGDLVAHLAGGREHKARAERRAQVDPCSQ